MDLSQLFSAWGRDSWKYARMLTCTCWTFCTLWCDTRIVWSFSSLIRQLSQYDEFVTEKDEPLITNQWVTHLVLSTTARNTLIFPIIKCHFILWIDYNLPRHRKIYMIWNSTSGHELTQNKSNWYDIISIWLINDHDSQQMFLGDFIIMIC